MHIVLLFCINLRFKIFGYSNREVINNVKYLLNINTQTKCFVLFSAFDCHGVLVNYTFKEINQKYGSITSPTSNLGKAV